jgi:hypothetical protein
MNEVNGMSDIEGKAAQGSGERLGREASFKHRSGKLLGFLASRSLSLIRENPCSSVAESFTVHAGSPINHEKPA